MRKRTSDDEKNENQLLAAVALRRWWSRELTSMFVDSPSFRLPSVDAAREDAVCHTPAPPREDFLTRVRLSARTPAAFKASPGRRCSYRHSARPSRDGFLVNTAQFFPDHLNRPLQPQDQ